MFALNSSSDTYLPADGCTRTVIPIVSSGNGLVLHICLKFLRVLMQIFVKRKLDKSFKHFMFFFFFLWVWRETVVISRAPPNTWTHTKHISILPLVPEFIRWLLNWRILYTYKLILCTTPMATKHCGFQKKMWNFSITCYFCKYYSFTFNKHDKWRVQS